MMIRAYRIRGHFHAHLDPLGLEPPKNEAELDPASYGFTEADYGRPISSITCSGSDSRPSPDAGDPAADLLLDPRHRVHAHLLARGEGLIQERIEGPHKGIAFTANGKKAILDKLIEAEGFKKFCDVKFTGTKRFGLDGGESVIPALEQIIKRGGQLGLQEIVLGMAHRGRLNVLAQVLGKPHRVIFHEFKGGSASPDEVPS